MPHSQSASPKRHPTPQIAWHHLGMVHKTLESDFRKNDTISMRSPSLNAITTVKHSLQSFFFLLKKLFNKVDPPKHFPFLRPHLVSHFKKSKTKPAKSLQIRSNIHHVSVWSWHVVHIIYCLALLVVILQIHKKLKNFLLEPKKIVYFHVPVQYSQ